MGNCKDCRWWENNLGANFGSCEKIAVPDTVPRGAPSSGHAHIVAILDPDGAEKQLTSKDDAECYIWLSVGPDFGCVQFQPKE